MESVHNPLYRTFARYSLSATIIPTYYTSTEQSLTISLTSAGRTTTTRPSFSAPTRRYRTFNKSEDDLVHFPKLG